MGKWYEIFRIPTEGKICEKTMVARVTVSTIVVLACLAAISVTAYAHFSANVTTSSNVISASGFRADVSVRVTDENGAIVPVSSDDGKAYTVTLKKDASYYVTVSPNADNTAKTGYVIVTVQGSDKRYHTQQIGLDGGVVTEAVSFRIQPNTDMTVEFLSHWGTSSYYCDYKEFGDVEPMYITQNETILLDGVVTESTTNTTTTTTVTTTETTAMTTMTTVATTVQTQSTTTVETQTEERAHETETHQTDHQNM